MIIVIIMNIIDNNTTPWNARDMLRTQFWRKKTQIFGIIGATIVEKSDKNGYLIQISPTLLTDTAF